jgi:hypothetical protein
MNNAFFASLGVFIVEPHTNALRLFAHFFRRLPRKIPVKNNFLGWQSSKKIERKILGFIDEFLVNSESLRLIWLVFVDKKDVFFFKGKIKSIEIGISCLYLKSLMAIRSYKK